MAVMHGGPATAREQQTVRVDAVFARMFDRRAVASIPSPGAPEVVRRALDETLKLEEDWDSYGAAPFDESLVERARDVADAIYREAFAIGIKLPAPTVSPGADDSIAFVWRRADGTADLEIVVTPAAVDFVASTDEAVDDGVVSGAPHAVQLLRDRIL
jgi:hypothetical protein